MTRSSRLQKDACDWQRRTVHVCSNRQGRESQFRGLATSLLVSRNSRRHSSGCSLKYDRTHCMHVTAFFFCTVVTPTPIPHSANTAPSNQRPPAAWHGPDHWVPPVWPAPPRDAVRPDQRAGPGLGCGRARNFNGSSVPLLLPKRPAQAAFAATCFRGSAAALSCNLNHKTSPLPMLPLVPPL